MLKVKSLLAHFLLVYYLVLLVTVAAAAPLWHQMGTDIDGVRAGDEAGTSVSLNGDGSVFAIGMNLNDGPTGATVDRIGLVRVYAYSGSTFQQRGQDLYGNAFSDQCGYSISLNAAGNVIALGSPKWDLPSADTFDNRGITRIFVWDGSSWVQRGANIQGDFVGGESGSAVSLSADGSVVAIGAPLANAGGTDRGSVRVLAWNGTAWAKRGNNINGEANNDEFGTSVALSEDGNVVAIGAPFNDGTATSSSDDRGHVRVFAWSTSDWVQRGADIDGKNAGDESGTSVAITADGLTVAIGSPYNDGTTGSNSDNRGHVQVFYWSGNTAWTQRGSNIVGETANDLSGTSVALTADGLYVAIGAPDNDGETGSNGDNRGHVRVFMWNGAWVQHGQDINGEAADDESGTSVALSRNSTTPVVAIGAPKNDGTSGSTSDNRGSGRVYFLLSDPTGQPTGQPSTQPTRQPSSQPSTQPSSQPSRQPSSQPSIQPTRQPTSQPSTRRSCQPSGYPSSQPSRQPWCQPSAPSSQPSTQPIGQPSIQPTRQPSSQPSTQPSTQPSGRPSTQPTQQPSSQPSTQPSTQPSGHPTGQPTRQPSSQPTGQPSGQPSGQPTCEPSSQPSAQPTCKPSIQPSTQPSHQPSSQPSSQPSRQPSPQPSSQPSVLPSCQPSCLPSSQPSGQPSGQPSSQPISHPSCQPSNQPSRQPSAKPTGVPSVKPSGLPSIQPTSQPTVMPSAIPISHPSMQPSSVPSMRPSAQPSSRPTTQPSDEPSSHPTATPLSLPSALPSNQPSCQPTAQPSGCPSGQPSSHPSGIPSRQPSGQPSVLPTGQPTRSPSRQPTTSPSLQPTSQPSMVPSRQPTSQPSRCPSAKPSCQPTPQPSGQPSSLPSAKSSSQPTSTPSSQPSRQPTNLPSRQPSSRPSVCPSGEPTKQPSLQPTTQPSNSPSRQPSAKLIRQPSSQPTSQPDSYPSAFPTVQPSVLPSMQPSTSPSAQPSSLPSCQPTSHPLTSVMPLQSLLPSVQLSSLLPSYNPSRQPSAIPTQLATTRMSFNISAIWNASQVVGLLYTLVANQTITNEVSADVRILAQVNLVTYPSLTYIPFDADGGERPLPSIAISPNSSQNSSVYVALAILDPSVWSPQSSNNLSPAPRQLQSSIVTTVVLSTDVAFVDIGFPRGSISNYTQPHPINFTVSCPPRVIVQKSYTCNDTGYVENIQCRGVLGKYQGTCPLMQQVCSSLNLSSMTVSSENFCQTLLSNVTGDLICRCKPSAGLLSGTTVVTTGIILGLVGTDLTKTFEASSAFSDGSAATKGAIVLSMFISIWGGSILLMLCFALAGYRRKFNPKVAKGAMSTESNRVAPADNNHDYAKMKAEFLSLYRTCLFPPVFSSSSALSGLLQELLRKHEYINFFFRLHLSEAPVIAVVKMGTLHSFLLFMLALLYDLNFPSDDGSCITHTTEMDCLERKFMFDPTQSYCEWKLITYLVTDDDGVYYECVYAEPTFSYATATYVSMMLSLAMCLFTDPLQFMCSLLGAPDESCVVHTFKAVEKLKDDNSLNARNKSSTVRQTEFAGGKVPDDGRRADGALQTLHSRRLSSQLVSYQSILTRIKDTKVSDDVDEIEAPIEVKMTRLEEGIQQERFLLQSKSPSILSVFDKDWCVDPQSGMFFYLKLSRKSASSIRRWEKKSVSDALSGRRWDVRLLVQRELEDVQEAAYQMQHELLDKSAPERGFEIMVQLVRDLLGRRSAAAMIYSLKLELEFEKFPRVKRWVKVAIVFVLLGMNGFFFYFTLLRGISKGSSWQQSYLAAWILQITLDIFVFETLQCAWFHYFVPSLVKKEVKHAQIAIESLLMSISEFPDEYHEEQAAAKSLSRLNAAAFLFVSYQLARYNPSLMESRIVKSYQSSMCHQAGQSWRRVVQKYAPSVARGDYDDVSDYIVVKESTSLFMWCSRAAGIPKRVLAALVIQLIIASPIEVQSLAIRVAEPAFMSGLLFLFLAVSHQPFLLGLSMVLPLILVLSLLWGHFRSSVEASSVAPNQAKTSGGVFNSPTSACQEMVGERQLVNNEPFPLTDESAPHIEAGAINTKHIAAETITVPLVTEARESDGSSDDSSYISSVSSLRDSFFDMCEEMDDSPIHMPPSDMKMN